MFTLTPTKGSADVPNNSVTVPDTTFRVCAAISITLDRRMAINTKKILFICFILSDIQLIKNTIYYMEGTVAECKREIFIVRHHITHCPSLPLHRQRRTIVIVIYSRTVYRLICSCQPRIRSNIRTSGHLRSRFRIENIVRQICPQSIGIGNSSI